MPKKWFLLAYLIVFWLFISNSSFFAGFMTRLQDEIISPYRQRLFSPPPTELPMPISPTVFLPTPNQSAPTPVVITEEALWQALMIYRQAQKRNEIKQEGVLCEYARMRAYELFKRLPDHITDPLDGHAGFQRDADSGAVFRQTGFTEIGENLAYVPGFTTATQIIEWGWDTSSGHRSLQLSNDITHGCISGVHPIYVGIYGKR